MTVRKLPDGRSILIHDGKPALVSIGLRPSSTAPGRLKATLAVLLDADKHVVTASREGVADAVQHLTMPFATPSVPVGALPVVAGYTPDFRLEMN